MPTIDLGPCECCGGGGTSCCNDFGTDWMPSGFDVDFSNATGFLSSTSAQQQSAVNSILQSASYSTSYTSGLSEPYDHGYGLACIPVPSATCQSNPCAGNSRTMARVNSGNNVIGGRLAVQCGDSGSGSAVYSIQLTGFSSNVTEIVEYLTAAQWATACQQGAGIELWILEFPAIPSSAVAGYTYNSALRRIENTDQNCDERTSAYQLPAASWTTPLTTVTVSKTYAAGFGLSAGFNKTFRYTITLTPTYAP